MIQPVQSRGKAPFYGHKIRDVWEFLIDKWQANLV
jgi:hypothetical protein